MKQFNQIKILLAILIIAATLRLYGLDWDQGQHLHPDERMITMVADRIHLPATDNEWQNIFTPQSSLNPNFFAYGSLPIYLLKVSGILAGFLHPVFSTYTGMNLVGRFLSALFDLGIIIIIFNLSKTLFNRKISLLASFLYAISVLPIQLAHFYAVDTPLTFFSLITLYFLIQYFEKLNSKFLILTAVFFGLSLATKTSALLLIVPIGITVFLKFSPRKIPLLTLTPLISLITFLVFEPFALIDFPTFLKQTLEQQQMTRSAFTFPYTLQYVGKAPYLYELQNIFFWGLGPLLATLTFLGSLLFVFKTFYPTLNTKYLILNTFFWLYFAVVGSFAIGFMRYMLPLYPLFCIFAAFFLHQLFLTLKPLFINRKSLFLILYSLFFILLLIWPLSFIHIYSQPNTRVSATKWINGNIPPGSIIAVEHWDDGLPIGTQANYKVMELPMYDSDSLPQKWQQVNNTLQNTQYIIIASNRLYVPLIRMTNCSDLPPGRCYIQTASYYQKLFNGSLGFQKIAEFSVLPEFPFLDPKFYINDFSADESFTVYDHPKIMIFQKVADIKVL